MDLDMDKMKKTKLIERIEKIQRISDIIYAENKTLKAKMLSKIVEIELANKIEWVDNWKQITDLEVKMQNEYEWHPEEYCQICGQCGAYDVEGNFVCYLCYEAYKEDDDEFLNNV